MKISHMMSLTLESAEEAKAVAIWLFDNITDAEWKINRTYMGYLRDHHKHMITVYFDELGDAAKFKLMFGDDQ